MTQLESFRPSCDFSLLKSTASTQPLLLQFSAHWIWLLCKASIIELHQVLAIVLILVYFWNSGKLCPKTEVSTDHQSIWKKAVTNIQQIPYDSPFYQWYDTTSTADVSISGTLVTLNLLFLLSIHSMSFVMTMVEEKMRVMNVAIANVDGPKWGIQVWVGLSWQDSCHHQIECYAQNGCF